MTHCSFLWFQEVRMSYPYSILVCIFLSFCSLEACVTTHAMFSKHMFARNIHMSRCMCMLTMVTWLLGTVGFDLLFESGFQWLALRQWPQIHSCLGTFGYFQHFQVIQFQRFRELAGQTG